MLEEVDELEHFHLCILISSHICKPNVNLLVFTKDGRIGLVEATHHLVAEPAVARVLLFPLLNTLGSFSSSALVHVVESEDGYGGDEEVEHEVGHVLVVLVHILHGNELRRLFTHLPLDHVQLGQE